MADARARLGLDNQTMFGMNPIEQIVLAAELGCGHVSLAPLPVPWKLDRFDAWSLRDDPALRRETKAALRDTGLRLALAEGFVIRPKVEAVDRLSDFDLMAELGAEAAATVSMEPDAARALDQMGMLAVLAAERGMTFLFEFAPPHTFNTLDKAVGAVVSLSQPNAKLLIDTMHFFRTGGDTRSLDAVADLIGHLQLCDAPLTGPDVDYYLEASFERLVPGEGELPLLAVLDAIPQHVRIGLEVPMQRALTASSDVRDPIERIVEGARALLTQSNEYAPTPATSG